MSRPENIAKDMAMHHHLTFNDDNYNAREKKEDRRILLVQIYMPCHAMPSKRDLEKIHPAVI